MDDAISRAEHISTHTPLARRDRAEYLRYAVLPISTHTPLAKRDCRRFMSYNGWLISTHTPLARRDISLKRVKNV